VDQLSGGESTKDIVRGVLVTSLICALSIHIPVFGFLFAVLIPLPVMFYRTRLGRRSGALVPGATLLVMTLLAGQVNFDIVFFVELMLIGFVLSELFERNLPLENAVLLTCGAVAGFLLAVLFFYSTLAEKGMGTLLADYVADNLRLTVKLYEGMGVPRESVDAILNSLEQVQYVLVRIIPALVIMSTLFVSWVNILLARQVFTARKLFFPDFGPLNQWKAPELLVWGAIAGAVLLFVPLRGVKMLGLNVLLILMLVYFFQGIGIASYFFEQKRFPRLLRIFLYSLIALQQVVVLVVIAFGFFDVWVDFRKLAADKSAEP
jgi:uncharacterized protein YybS (DUF2232 family)